MAGIFPTVLAIGFGLFALLMVWSLLNRGAKQRRAALGDDAIDQSASEMIEKHGDDADKAVAELGAECLAIGDFEGEAIWKQVAKSIAKMQAEKAKNAST
ncbi:MAG: hypothetical protein HKN28_18070 [Alphaproteobacteria bacterium]|nr:hypothetical protein [Alphaproteobacteria bacterium]